MRRVKVILPLAALAFGVFSCNIITFPIEPINEYTTPSHWTNQHQIIMADSESIPDSVQTFYRESASFLAERVLYNSSDSANTPVQIPPELTNLFYHGLLHIYDANSIPARDTIMQFVWVAPWPSRSIYNTIISVDPDAQWLQPWFTGDTLTGNAAIDTLLQTYNLYPSEIHYFEYSYDVYLHSEIPINTTALAAKFAPLPDIQHAIPEMFGGDGNDVEVEIDDSHLTYNFYIKWGDCFAGCMNKRIWTFYVTYNGNVTFEGSSGDPITWDISG